MRNLKKKWKKEGTLEAHVQAYKERQTAPVAVLTPADRSQTLKDVVRQMRAGMSVRKAAKVCQDQGVLIQKSALYKRKIGETVRDTAGAPPKLPEELVQKLVDYAEAVKVHTLPRIHCFTFIVSQSLPRTHCLTFVASYSLFHIHCEGGLSDSNIYVPNPCLGTEND
jgi:hypothetical protein